MRVIIFYECAGMIQYFSKAHPLRLLINFSAKGTLNYGYQSRVLMTGTPLQNNTQELWTLLNFIEPSLFRSMEEFDQNFGNMANREQVEALQRKISPFMLRRVSSCSVSFFFVLGVIPDLLLHCPPIFYTG